MSNPFQPPTAEVADVHSAVEVPSRPIVVAVACILLCASMVAAGASFMLTFREDFLTDESIPFGFSMGIAAFILALFALEAMCIFYAYRRANWARWFLLGMSALGWFFIISPPVDWLEGSTVEIILDLATTLLETVGCVLLFTGKAREWFAVQIEG